MSNMLPAFYEFFYFPDAYKALFDETVLFKNKSEKDIQAWKDAYIKLIIKAKVNTQGKNVILKNPVNTGRIGKILEIYPKARFIHIYRNPVVVYLSTKKFFQELIPTLQLQKTSPEQIQEMIFDLYAKLMQAYFEQKSLIPQDQLIEISFESFEGDPLKYLKDIYRQLEIGDWQQVAAHFETYLQDLGSYQRNVYRISQEELDRIKKDWQFAFDKLGYEVPESLEII